MAIAEVLAALAQRRDANPTLRLAQLPQHVIGDEANRRDPRVMAQRRDRARRIANAAATARQRDLFDRLRMRFDLFEARCARIELARTEQTGAHRDRDRDAVEAV